MIVVWSQAAVRDLRALREYIAEFDPPAAAASAARILEAVDMLTRFPGMGRPGRRPQTRELVVPGTPYIVPYRVVARRFEIIALLHGARRWTV